MSEPTFVSVFDQDVDVTVGVPGIQGPPGPAGEDGQDGVTTIIYEGGAAYHRHQQDTPAAVWSIPHPLGYRPTVTVSDTAGTVIEGDVRYLSDSLVEVSFSVAFTGVAYLT